MLLGAARASGGGRGDRIEHVPADRYRLYVDESGDHTFSRVADARDRYLGLLGVWFKVGEPYDTYSEYLRRLKEAIWGRRPDEAPICLHRKDIMDRKGPFGVLRDAEIAAKFDRGLEWIFNRTPFLMCCVVLDKQSHASKKYRTLYHPYHYCLAALLERYAGWLQLTNSVGDVMAEARGRTEDRELERVFEEFYNYGTRFHDPDRVQKVLTSRKLKFRKKEHNIPGLQAADLLAHPATREIIAEHGNSTPPDDFGSRILNSARRNFNRQVYSGRVAGYGKILLN